MGWMCVLSVWLTFLHSLDMCKQNQNQFYATAQISLNFYAIHFGGVGLGLTGFDWWAGLGGENDEYEVRCLQIGGATTAHQLLIKCLLRNVFRERTYYCLIKACFRRIYKSRLLAENRQENLRRNGDCDFLLMALESHFCMNDWMKLTMLRVRVLNESLVKLILYPT